MECYLNTHSMPHRTLESHPESASIVHAAIDIVQIYSRLNVNDKAESFSHSQNEAVKTTEMSPYPLNMKRGNLVAHRCSRNSSSDRGVESRIDWRSAQVFHRNTSLEE